MRCAASLQANDEDGKMMSGDAHVDVDGGDGLYDEASHAAVIVTLSSYSNRIESEITPSFIQALSRT